MDQWILEQGDGAVTQIALALSPRGFKVPKISDEEMAKSIAASLKEDVEDDRSESPSVRNGKSYRVIARELCHLRVMANGVAVTMNTDDGKSIVSAAEHIHKARVMALRPFQFRPRDISAGLPRKGLLEAALKEYGIAVKILGAIDADSKFRGVADMQIALLKEEAEAVEGIGGQFTDD